MLANIQNNIFERLKKKSLVKLKKISRMLNLNVNLMVSVQYKVFWWQNPFQTRPFSTDLAKKWMKIGVAESDKNLQTAWLVYRYSTKGSFEGSFWKTGPVFEAWYHAQFFFLGYVLTVVDIHSFNWLK